MNQTKKLFIRIAVWIPAIIMAFMIFGFSSQDGTESGGLSRKAAGIVIDVADGVHIIDVTNENRESYLDKIEYPIRKCAHMTEYAILGVLICIAFMVDGLKHSMARYIAFAGTVAFACTDEIHQLFVPDRSGRFSDVLIDSFGCLIGLIIVFLIDRARSNNHKNLSK